MALVKLQKEISTYTDKDGNEKVATNFSVVCGDMTIPIEVKYFENKETGKDSMFFTRKTVLSSYADEVPAYKKSDSADSNK